MSATMKPRVPDALRNFPRSAQALAPQVRGDPITGDRYYSREFMDREWQMWKRVWHVGARIAQIPEPGDFVVHNFRHESVVMIRQDDGRVRAFFNVCRHRGNRLFWNDAGTMAATISCPYHGWRWAPDGSLRHVQDPEDFPQGNPCGKVTLKEVPCDTWGGFVWYSMDRNAGALRDYLDPVPELLANRDLDSWVRVLWRTLEVNTNWKFASDNFNESYHLPAVHPQLQSVVDEDYKSTLFEMYPSGHNRMIELGRPSLRAVEPNEVDNIWAAMLREWDLDPDAFRGRARDGRLALQQQRRKLGIARGHTHFAKLTDDELTDQFHHTLFPNVTITGTPEGLHFFRTEPHATDPEKCTFDYWYMVPRIEGQSGAGTIYGVRPIEEAEQETGDFATAKATLPIGDFLAQDLSVAEMQQRGLHSMGYEDAYLSGQETRVRRFHEVLNDYLEGRR